MAVITVIEYAELVWLHLIIIRLHIWQSIIYLISVLLHNLALALYKQ